MILTPPQLNGQRLTDLLSQGVSLSVRVSCSLYPSGPSVKIEGMRKSRAAFSTQWPKLHLNSPLEISYAALPHTLPSGEAARLNVIAEAEIQAGRAVAKQHGVISNRRTMTGATRKAWCRQRVSLKVVSTAAKAKEKKLLQARQALRCVSKL